MREELLRRTRDECGIVGRKREIAALHGALVAGRHVLIEGPVGVGKTALASAAAKALGKAVIRVDGDTRYTEQKLAGHWDPALVMEKGYAPETFLPGPLVSAMRDGTILFLNELNRMPESVQNVLLPAMDEGLLQVPQIGEIRAKTGFQVIATQNPREFVATSQVSEALLDRMEWLSLGYQSFDEEREIAARASGFEMEPFLSRATEAVRATRSHPKIRRGASVRAAIAILGILKGADGLPSDEDFLAAVRLALPNRIELAPCDDERPYPERVEALLDEIVNGSKKK